jgi:hypothetical protein
MKVSVGSADEWDRLIAEGEIESKIGFIVSDEQGEFRVSLFLLPSDAEDFAYCRNQPSRTVRLDQLFAALEEARTRLIGL